MSYKYLAQQTIDNLYNKQGLNVILYCSVSGIDGVPANVLERYNDGIRFDLLSGRPIDLYLEDNEKLFVSLCFGNAFAWRVVIPWRNIVGVYASDLSQEDMAPNMFTTFFSPCPLLVDKSLDLDYIQDLVSALIKIKLQSELQNDLQSKEGRQLGDVVKEIESKQSEKTKPDKSFLTLVKGGQE